jgi:hypothetical protein
LSDFAINCVWHVCVCMFDMRACGQKVSFVSVVCGGACGGCG